MQEVLYALRVLRRNPGFTLIALICIALGIGVTTTIFSAVNGILLRPMPFPRDKELVSIHSRNLARDISGSRISWADYASWRDENRSISQIGIWAQNFQQLSGPEGDTERVVGAAISANLFPILGVKPLYGRNFTEAEERAPFPRVIILSYGLWQRRYGGDTALLGHTIQMGTAPALVVGILPPGISFPEGAQSWIPAAVDPQQEKHGARRYTAAIGRLKPGVTVDQTAADLTAVSRRLQAAFPTENEGWDTEVTLLREDLVGSLRKPVLIFLGAAVLVLLIATANVGNLLLARGASRRREMAIRVAVGADRWSIIRQVLMESIILSLAGGLAGTVIARFGVRLLTLAFPDGVPSYIDLSIDTTVVLFTTAVALLTGVLFGLIPALSATRTDVRASLHEESRGSAGSIAGGKIRSLLVSLEIALSVVLTIGATLLIRTDLTLERELGFQTRGVLTFRVPLPSPKYDAAGRLDFYARLRDRVRAIPGVQSVGGAQGIPLGSETGPPYDRAPLIIAGRASAHPGEELNVMRSSISPGYLKSMGIPLLSGRDFTEGDLDPSVHIGIINEEFAKRHFPSVNPIGQQIGFPKSPMLTIVGVARNSREDQPPLPIEPLIYLPMVEGSQTLVVRTSLDQPLSVAPSIRAIVREMDPGVPAYLMQQLDQIVARAFWRQRLQGRVLGIFGSLALVLAVFGVYGVISYAVTQRTREFGVRVAMGASRGNITAVVLKHGVRLGLAGVTAGVFAALALTRLLTGLLYGIQTTDPWTFLAVSALLIAVALLAAAIPAWRASNVDPLIAIRTE